MSYKSGPRVYHLTPKRKRAVKQAVRRSLVSSAKNQLADEENCDAMLTVLKTTVEKEIKQLSKRETRSIFQGSNQDLKSFSWDSVWKELMQSTPTLVRFISAIIPHADYGEHLVCFVASMIMKKETQLMSFVQQAISVLFYVNGCSKQVTADPKHDCNIYSTVLQIYNCLQPLMVCMSHKETLRVVDSLAKDFDSDVTSWCSQLYRQNFEVYQPDRSVPVPHINCAVFFSGGHK